MNILHTTAIDSLPAALHTSLFPPIPTPVGYAIVGAGMISHFHAQSLALIPEASLIGIYDKVPEAAQTFAATYHIHAYSAYSALLADPAVHAVILCTPSGLREDFAVQAAIARKHVICEKPMEITPERIDHMIEICRQNNVTLTGIFNNRYNRVYQYVKEAIDQGDFGKMILGDVYVKWYRAPAYYESSSWKGTWQYDGGGALMNQSIHFIDLLQWLMGPVSSIKSFAQTCLHPIEVEDTAVAVLAFESGALGVIEGTTAARPGLHDRLELHGSNGSVLIENSRILYWNLQNRPLPEEELASLNQPSQGNSSDPKAIDFNLHRLELAEITHHLQTGTPPPLSGQEARKSVEIIQRIYQDAGIRS